VDCPGHAGLIKTVICGSQIIDISLLVVDVTKGLQLQTLECIMISEIFAPRILVVLNKIDQIPPKERESAVTIMEHKIRRTLSKIKLDMLDFITFSTKESMDFYCHQLKSHLSKFVDCSPKTDVIAHSLLVVTDHCFAVKGSGSVLTGTVLSGNLHVGDAVEIRISGGVDRKKIKLIQMFHESVLTASAVNLIHSLSKVSVLCREIESPFSFRISIPKELSVGSFAHRTLS